MAQKRVFWLFVVLALIYFILIVLIPAEKSTLARYQISQDQLRLLRLTMAVPIVVIWFIGFYGFSKVKSYSKALGESSEGPAFNKIAQGLLVLALWLPITVIISNINSYIVYNYANYIEATAIIENYINVLVILLALYFLYQGTGLLIKRVKKISLPSRSILNIIFFTMSAFFVYWTLVNPARQFPLGETQEAAYYLPDWLLIPTIIVPYLAAFYFGLQAVQNILLYRYKVKGVLYKNALTNLANGIGIITLSLISIRFLSAFTEFIGDATLKIILTIIYTLLFFLAIGYALTAWGARKLQKIEEV